MLSFMHAQYSLFQQGYNLLDELDPYMKKLAAEVSGASSSPLNIRSTSWASHSLSSRVATFLFWTIDRSQLHNLSVRFPRNDWNLVTRCAAFIYRILKACVCCLVNVTDQQEYCIDASYVTGGSVCVCQWKATLHFIRQNNTREKRRVLQDVWRYSARFDFLCVRWLSVGSAGDWFSHGKEGNGAQTCNHSAKGEFRRPGTPCSVSHLCFLSFMRTFMSFFFFFLNHCSEMYYCEMRLFILTACNCFNNLFVCDKRFGHFEWVQMTHVFPDGEVSSCYTVKLTGCECAHITPPNPSLPHGPVRLLWLGRD